MSVCTVYIAISRLSLTCSYSFAHHLVWASTFNSEQSTTIEIATNPISVGWKPMMYVYKLYCTPGQGNSKQFRCIRVRPMGLLVRTVGVCNWPHLKDDLPKEQDNPASLLGSLPNAILVSMLHSHVSNAYVPFVIPVWIILNPAPL